MCNGNATAIDNNSSNAHSADNNNGAQGLTYIMIMRLITIATTMSLIGYSDNTY